MSSVRPEQTNEAGGLQGTAQNLGASLGTALIGAVLIAALTNGFVERDRGEPGDPGRSRERVAEIAEEGIPVVPVDDVEQAARDAGLPPDQAQAIADDYGDAQLQGLKRAIGAVAMFALLSLWFTSGLPGRAPPAHASQAPPSATPRPRSSHPEGWPPPLWGCACHCEARRRLRTVILASSSREEEIMSSVPDLGHTTLTSDVSRRETTDEARRGTSWVLFAGIMLATVAILNVIWGLAAVAKSSFFVADASYILLTDLRAWGWIALAIGALGSSPPSRSGADARSGAGSGIAVAVLGIIGALMSMPASPLWSLVVVALGILVIYGLTMLYGGRPESTGEDRSKRNEGGAVDESSSRKWTIGLLTS